MRSAWCTHKGIRHSSYTERSTEYVYTVDDHDDSRLCYPQFNKSADPFASAGVKGSPGCWREQGKLMEIE